MPIRLRWCWFILAGIAAGLCSSGTALALNPNHGITQYRHRIWQGQPGLSLTSIYVVKQTRDGYLWLGTLSGVVRFDGARFSPVPALQQASLGDIWIRDMEEDSAGNVWMTANDFSLIRAGQGGVKVFTEEDGLPTKEFSCVFPGPGGEIWSCIANGVVRFRGDQSDVYQDAAPFTTRPTAGCRAADGKVWFGGGSLLKSWDGTRFSQQVLRSVTGDLSIHSLVCTDDELWIATAKGLVRLKGAQESVYTTKDGLADNVILSLASGSNGDMWAGTRKGFSRIRKGVIESFGSSEGLSQNTVYALSEDREGSLWVGTKNGLNQFLDGAATRYTRNEGLPGENMGAILEDRRGNLWAGTLDGGLARFDGQRFSPVASLASGSITTLAESGDGALWAGTDRGLNRLQDGQVRETYGVAQGLPSPAIRSLFRDSGGNLWAGTQKGVALFREGRFVSPPALAKDLAGPIASIGETRDGTMLFAVEHGSVFLFKNGRLRKLEDNSPAPRLPFQDVTSIYTDPEGVVWMGANGGGLGMWRDGKLSRFLVRDGLYDNEIYGFVPDAKDRLWMACSNGFFWVTRADLFKYASGKVQKVTSSPYSPLDGLKTVQGTPGVQPVGVRAKDGRVWFSSTAWLMAFAPDLGIRNLPPPVTIEEVTVNGSSIEGGHALDLEADQNSVAFRYTALTFIAPGRLNFRYILEGYDKNWTDAGARREAFYTNLPPGKFRFRVGACDGMVPCNETASALQFEILPHVYQRAWFIPLCVAALGLLVWITHRFRVRQLRAQFVLVLAERSRIARELHDTLIQGFSGITMQMQAFTSRLRTSEDRQALGEIIRDAGICLQETRRSVAGLRAGTASSSGLAAAISDAAHQLTQERDLRLKLHLDDRHQQLPAEVKYNLLCIVQEAITNSIKHSGAHTVEVTLACSPQDLRVSIRDDGRGFTRGSNGANGGGADGGHYGLVGMRERASQIGAEFELSSTPGLGTRVSVRVPVTREIPAASSPEKVAALR